VIYTRPECLHSRVSLVHRGGWGFAIVNPPLAFSPPPALVAVAGQARWHGMLLCSQAGVVGEMLKAADSFCADLTSMCPLGKKRPLCQEGEQSPLMVPFVSLPLSPPGGRERHISIPKARVGVRLVCFPNKLICRELYFVLENKRLSAFRKKRDSPCT
jgi:hypothetical protein